MIKTTVTSDRDNYESSFVVKNNLFGGIFVKFGTFEAKSQLIVWCYGYTPYQHRQQNMTGIAVNKILPYFTFVVKTYFQD